MPLSLTLSGNETTDAIRLASLKGDGRAYPDGSMGIWRGTTNLFANGGLETNMTGWTIRGPAITGLARSTEQQKFGAASAKITIGTGWQEDWGADTSVAVSPLTVYTVSMWLKSDGINNVRFSIQERDSGSPVGAIQATSQTSTSAPDWERVAFTFTTSGTTNALSIYVGHRDITDQNFSFYCDGVQVEAQPFDTPYVDTDGGSAARAAASVLTGIGNSISETQGWFATRFRYGYPQGSAFTVNPHLFSWYDNASNFIILQRTASTTWQAQRRSAAAGGAAAVALSFSEGSILTIICAWDATTVKASINGAVFTSAANTSIPSLAETQVAIGRRSDAVGGAGQCDSDIFWAAIGTGTLMDADAATIHALGNADMYPQDFPGSCIMVWHAKDGNALAGSDTRSVAGSFVALELV